MRMGVGMAVLATAFVMAGAAQAQDAAGQMRVAFDICADFAAERADLDTAIAAANAAGFPGTEPASMTWTGQGGLSRVRLALAIGGANWCSISTSDPAVDAVALAEESMNWASRRLTGPWRHARASQPMGADAYGITGFNGRISVTATQPTRGGVRVMVMNQTATQWIELRDRMGAEAVELETTPYVAPPPPSAPGGPSTRDLTLTALNQCYAFLADGERPAWTDTAGVSMTLSDRGCAVAVSAPPPDPALMEAALEVITRQQRALTRSRQDTGFRCIMHRVEVQGRNQETVASCDRLAPAGQTWLSIQITKVR